MATKKKKSSTSATLKLDSAFYPRAALNLAQNAFSKLATIEIRRQGQETVIRFTGMTPAVAAKLPDEFANYVLSCAVTSP